MVCALGALMACGDDAPKLTDGQIQQRVNAKLEADSRYTDAPLDVSDPNDKPDFLRKIYCGKELHGMFDAPADFRDGDPENLRNNIIFIRAFVDVACPKNREKVDNLIFVHELEPEPAD